MQSKSSEYDALYASPISLLGELFSQYEWDYDCTSEYEITAETEGRWCNYRIFAMWRPEFESLVLTALIDIKIAADKRSFVETLLSAMNPKVYLGHFEVAPEDDVPAFRYNLTLRGNPNATIEQLEEIVSSSVIECDRLYPALQFVLWGGKNPQEALMAAMMETHGEA